MSLTPLWVLLNAFNFALNDSADAFVLLFSKNGIFVMANNTDLDRLQIIDYYRSKDSIEKVFDVMKNELLGKRLRAHSKESAEGRLFVKFITSILYSSISKIMKEKALFKNYSLRELMLELNTYLII